MARDFNGSSDFLESGTMPGSNTDNFTAHAWVWTDDAGATERVCYMVGQDDSNLGFSAEQESGNWKLLLNGIVRIDSTVAVVSGAWHSLVVLRDAGTMKMFLNGTGIISNGTTPGLPWSGGKWDIGRQYATIPQRYWDGRICEFAWWDSVLSGANITALAGGAQPDTIGTPTTYMPICGTASPETNRVGGGPTLTVTGTTPIAHPVVTSPCNLPKPSFRLNSLRPRPFTPGLAR